MPGMNIHSYQYALKNSLFSQALKDPCRTHFDPQSFELDRSVVVFFWGGTQFVDSLFWHTITCSRELVFQARFSFLCCLCYSRTKFWKTTSTTSESACLSKICSSIYLTMYLLQHPWLFICAKVKRLTIDPYWVWASPPFIRFNIPAYVLLIILK